MALYFSKKAETAAELIWMQYDRDKILEGRRMLQEAADADDGDAACLLARTYMGGTYVWWASGMEANEGKAEALLRKSVKLGSSCGILTAMEWGALVDQEPYLLLKDAYEAVLQQAEAGHPFCQYFIGCVYSRWIRYFPGGLEELEDLKDLWDLMGLFEDSAPDCDREPLLSGKEKQALLRVMEERALYWNEKALYSGITFALANIHTLPQKKTNTQEADPRMQRAIRFAAERGDPMWQTVYAAWLYRRERYVEALDWYERAAMGGEADAWYDVAYQHDIGQGTAQDDRKAAWAYGQGAQSGIEECMLPFGKCLLAGRGVDRDPYQAYLWFSREAETGGEIGKLYQGHCLFRGLGVKQDTDKGVGLLLEAQDYDFPEDGAVKEYRLEYEEHCLLYLDLGDAYEQGRGVPKNEHQAGRYFAALAKSGHEEGALRLSHYKQTLFRRWRRIREEMPEETPQAPVSAPVPSREASAPEPSRDRVLKPSETVREAYTAPPFHPRRRRPGRMLGTPCYRVTY